MVKIWTEILYRKPKEEGSALVEVERLKIEGTHTLSHKASSIFPTRKYILSRRLYKWMRKDVERKDINFGLNSILIKEGKTAAHSSLLGLSERKCSL